jgi:DNA-binding Xre family transcriptional regulator
MSNMSHEAPSTTFDRWMQDREIKKIHDEHYNELVLAELTIALMEENEKSVRELAKEIGISPSVIQDLRSGHQKDIKLSNFLKMMKVFGYHLCLQKGNTRIDLNAI